MIPVVGFVGRVQRSDAITPIQQEVLADVVHYDHRLSDLVTRQCDTALVQRVMLVP